ncbi:multicopper oxidase family protein [Devosia rhizoryzae]|uniref:Multicopper oxidase family protein n=2 Tax=Devosia rhizoryzae TaxID=2774137 RepID=A0ABX7C9X1_9HYPH|nr:multicopper oxidase family protein [Devosia rhizoryzae]
MNRRSFLATTAAGAALALLGGSKPFAAVPATRLTVGRRSIEVAGRGAQVFGVTDTAGNSGILVEGDRFHVDLVNDLAEATTVHWHGQVPAPEADGIAETGYVTPLAPGEGRAFDFAARPGTHWMHSHHELQEQALLTAPLIVKSASELRDDVQDVVVMLNDFSFKNAEEILAGLRAREMDHGAMSGMDHGGSMDMDAMMATGTMDLNDVEYDAFLANDRTLDDPQIVKTERNGKVRLRIINGAASTAFWIDLSPHTGKVVAVDGNEVLPVSGSRFPIAQAQRLDIVLQVPAGATVPVLARREGGRARTGMILAAPGTSTARLAGEVDDLEAAVDLSLEHALRSREPISARVADRTLSVMLTGSMAPYSWTIDDRDWTRRKPLEVKAGERVELKLMNHTMMAHPMHLHGHHFQVVGIDGRPLAGAVRDTVLVPSMGTVTVAFDADNPGRWLYHCHNLYHMAAGMMSELVYI